jgi:serine/threonine protein kinase
MGQELPQKFGKCRVVRLLGQGATAMVYLATHEGLDIPVAVKVLRKRLSDKRPEYAERFLREARMAAWLEHPNIVRVIDCGVEDGFHYMVMDYVDGPNCLEKLQDQPEGLDWHEATGLVQQAVSGLAYAAGRDVIHRDVKPSNIMVDSTGRVRVTDLGLAKLTIKGMAELTQELHTVGTPNYMSPEQIRSPSDLDLRTDIYSLGATYYHLVCGRPPFSGKTPMEVIAHHLSTPLTPPFKVRPGLPPPLSSVVCKMMAKSPTERYQSYNELSADLASLQEGRGTTADGFSDTGVGIEDEKELRRLLDSLAFGNVLSIDRGEEAPRATREVEADEEVEHEGSTTIDLFGPEDLAAYHPPPGPSDSTVLAQQLVERRRRFKSLVIWLVIISVLFLITIAVLASLSVR